MADNAGRLPADLARRRAALPIGEERLAQLAAAGDERAFATLYRRHHQELYRYCRAILGDPDEAQDALQSTMVKALRSLPGETREIALRPWLYRVAHNEAITLLRARRAESQLDHREPDLAADVEQQAATRERLRMLVGDLEQLPERQRGALVMRELSGLGFEQIGEAFEIAPAAAKQAVYEARMSLQAIAEGREMGCAQVRESISAHDRRLLRSRRMRSHLRSCAGCRDFETAIATRREDLAALAPPIALPAALAALYAAIGGASTAAPAGIAGGALGAGGVIGGAAAAKTAASLLAAATIAGGAAEVSGVIDLGIGGPSEPRPAEQSAPPPAAAPHAPELSVAPAHHTNPAPTATREARGASGDGERGQSAGRGQSESRGQSAGRRHGEGRSERAAFGHAHGVDVTTPGQAAPSPGPPPAPPGQTSTPPGQGRPASTPANPKAATPQVNPQGTTVGGGTASAPGQAHATGATGPPAHSSAAGEPD